MEIQELKERIFKPTKQQELNHSKNFALTYVNLHNFYSKKILYNNTRNFYQNIIFHQNLTKLQQANFDTIDNIKLITEANSININQEIKSEIFATFHLGSYRSLNSFLIKKGVDITLLVDNQSYKKQGAEFISSFEKINAHYKNGGTLQIIDAEQPSSFRKIMGAINTGSNLVIYLDGNTGSKKNTDNKNLLKIPFLNGEIYSRVGVCHLSILLKAKITPVLSYFDDEKETATLHFFDSLDLMEKGMDKVEYVKKTISHIYAIFISFLEKYPSQWEGWLYMHKWIDHNLYRTKYENDLNDKNLDSYLVTNFEELVPFSIGKEYFFINKTTYLSYIIDYEKYLLLNELKK